MCKHYSYYLTIIIAANNSKKARVELRIVRNIYDSIMIITELRLSITQILNNYKLITCCIIIYRLI